MHGIYKIKVKLAHNHAPVVEYTGCAHPKEGEYITIDDKRAVVMSVEHHIRSGRDGSGVWHSLDYVEISVAFRSKLN